MIFNFDFKETNVIWLRFFLVFVTAIVYTSVLFKGFSTWDDNWMLYENRQVFDLSAENIRHYFSSFYSGQYSPINTLSYGLIYEAFKLDPSAYHFFGMVLHLINVLLVFEFVRKISTDHPNSLAISFLTAILFGVCPMQVESVAWISASKITLYSTFFLLSLICYLNFLSEKKIIFFVLSIILFLVSFGAKEQAVMLPCCLILIDFLMGRKLLSTEVIVEKIPFFLMSIILGYITLNAQNMAFNDQLNKEYHPLWQRTLLANFSIIEYLYKIIIPNNLAKFYAFPMEPGEPIPVKYWLYPLFVLVLGGWAYNAFKNGKKHVVFGLGFFLVNLILAIHVFPMARKAFLADRYVYLSSIGIFFLIATEMMNYYAKATARNRTLVHLLSTFYVFLMLGYAAWYCYRW